MMIFSKARSKEIMDSLKRILFMATLVGLASCRGQFSERPPVHPNPNMDNMSKIKAQRSYVDIDGDGQSNLITPPPGTVPWGRHAVSSLNADRDEFLRADAGRFTGKNESGYLRFIPSFYTVDKSFLDRGQERYNIYCASCHDRAGTGKGPVSRYGIGKVPTFADAKFDEMADGMIYETITLGNAQGKGAMKGYAKQIPVDDRWAIVSYVRALQFNMKQPKKEVP